MAPVRLQLAAGLAWCALTAPAWAASLNADALQRFPPPGRMVDVAVGRRLHILCKGPAQGPTVVIETGAFASSLYYWRAQDEVARLAHVCTYDRAGLGWSDPAPAPRSLADRVADLHALLRNARVKGPYILLGHSMGGLLVRAYAKTYPREVAGVGLMESSEEIYNGRPDNTRAVAATARPVGGAIQAAEAGVDIPALHPPKAPREEPVAIRASVFRAGQEDLATMARLPDELRALGGLGELGRTPLVVVSRGRPDGLTPAMYEGWKSAQARLPTLSSRSASIVAENSGHNIQYDEPERYAQATRRLLEMIAAR